MCSVWLFDYPVNDYSCPLICNQLMYLSTNISSTMIDLVHIWNKWDKSKNMQGQGPEQIMSKKWTNHKHWHFLNKIRSLEAKIYNKLGLSWAKLRSCWVWTILWFSVNLVSLDWVWQNWLGGFSFAGLVYLVLNVSNSLLGLCHFVDSVL